MTSVVANAQTIQFTELLNATVKENGQDILSPFCGGLNATQPNHADLNNDGKKDITIYDQNTRTLKTFINVGDPGESKYQYQPRFAKNFPYISYYLKLIDYNCDGVPDLIHKGSGGFSIYSGYYNGQNELSFTYYKDLYYSGNFGPVNAYVQPNDIPIVADLDGDGDLDFTSFDVLGAYSPWYRNLQVEDSLPCDSIRIILEDNCFGKMYQTFNRTHILNATCKGVGGSNKKQRHSGNCILALDVNGDGLQDMLGGNISFSDVQLLINTGTSSAPTFTIQDTLFDTDGHQLEMHSWPASFYFDIDNDNDKDLVFTPHNDNISSANYNAMAVYKNEGTTAVPNFKWTNDSAFVDQIIDVGRNSHPTLFDYDKDGKLDLFIGGEGYFNTNILDRVSAISYYKNTSTVGTVSYELVTRDFLNISAKNYRGVYPTFGDITGNGVDDLILGNDSGTITVYQNTAASNTATPSFTWQLDNYAGIDVGEYSFPVIYDFNSDGKTDLLIGCQLGTLWLYEDTSATSNKELKRIDSSASGIKTGSQFSFFSYGVPYVGRVDSSSKEYLLVGTTDGTIERYDNFTNQYTNWLELDSNMANIQTAYRAAPAIADVDGDQRPELFIGNQNGGLRLFQFDKNIDSTVSTKNVVKNNIPVQLYPNPTKGELWLVPSQGLTKIESYQIYDMTGRIVKEENESREISEAISTKDLTNGIYFIKLEFDKNRTAIAKFIYQN
jgi:hypothetical protein